MRYNYAFLHYCTGDVHIGYNETLYEDPNGEGNPETIYHYGAYNTYVKIFFLFC